MTNQQDRCLAEIALLMYPESQLAAVHGLTDLFRIASEWVGDDPKPWIRVTHWVPQEDETEASVTCIWDSHPGPQHQLDYVIVPPSIAMPEKMQSMPEAGKWLKDQHGRGSRICSVCAGAFVLAESGLIDGRTVTTHWAFAQALSSKFPQIDVADQHMVLDDGDIITAGGILAWTDLGLTLVERLMGPSAMLATARFLLIDPPRQLQRPFRQFIPKFHHGDESVLQVQHHIHAHVAEPHNLTDLADLAGMGGRTFLRRFSKATGLKPTEYVQNVRISKAREILELTGKTVDQITWEVGYSDPAAFRKVFQRLTGLAPNAYRQRFGIGENQV
ncbi:GlxA family transcriptional regulator [Roseibium sp.]|uniref:GlxA family transcriptional regulator n=1 Tax=Roseibium sp. TaxID=1936156 RepID=UPI003B517840